jgi:hypothetical protein
MKSIHQITVLLFLSTVLTSCFWGGSCITPETAAIEKTIDLQNFNKIKLSSSVEVFLTQAASQTVTIKAPQEIIDLLNTEVDGDEWEIKFDECFNSNVSIHIALPHLEELSVNGSGSIVGKGPFVVKDLELDINGSGDIKLEINAEEVEVSIKGSGDISLAGEAKETDISVMGSGDLQALKLETEESDISIKGSGDVKVNVTKRIDIGIYGSGDVQYRGNPKQTEINIKGSGEIKKLD